MLSQPKKTKFRKYFKSRQLPDNKTKTLNLTEGNCFALVAKESGYLNARQIEAARQNIRRKVKREGKLEIFITPNIPVSHKPSAARMGKGKGKVDHWVVALAAGQTLLSLYGTSQELSVPALNAGARKLPLSFRVQKL